MRKKPNLAAALHEAAKPPAPTPIAAAKKTAPAPAPAAVAQGRRPSRVGKKCVAGYFDPAVSRQLRQMALDADVAVQDLLQEALNDLFKKHSRKPIA